MKLVKLVFALLLLLGVGLGLLIYNLGPLTKAGVEKIGPTVVKTPVSIGNVAMNWAEAEVAFSDFLIGNPEGYVKDHLFVMGKVTVQLDTASLLSDEIHIKQILIDSPIINYEQKISESNISRVLDNVRSLKTTKEPEVSAPQQQGPGKRVVIDYLRISNAGVYASSELLGNKEKYITLKELDLYDIGKDGDNGLASVVEKVLSEIQRSVITQLPGTMFSLGAQESATDDVENQVNGVGDKVRRGLESGIDSAKESLNEGIGELKKLLSQ